MDPYIIVLAGFGVVVLLTAWLPLVLKELPLSLSILCVFLGFVIFRIPGTGVSPDPLTDPHFTERLTELVLIVALTGAGLKVDRPLGLRSWRLAWRLLGITMPLTIAGITILAWSLVDLPVASALLLAAVLAPTDPVLASDIQVGPPGSGEEDEVRLSLTAEAGLNDGLAFPFVIVALALQADGASGITLTLALEILWSLAIGVLVGWSVGKALGYVTFHLPHRAQLSRTGDGFVALGVACVSYGLALLVEGNGFVAVFLTAVALRQAERAHDYHHKLHDFADQLERLMTMLILVLFGGAVAGGLLDQLTSAAAAVGLLTMLLVRPVATFLGLAGSGAPVAEQAVIGFFGIRGIGSLYYMAHGLNHAGFAQPHLLWAITGFVVLTSIFVHGTTVTPMIRRLDQHRSSRRRTTARPARP